MEESSPSQERPGNLKKMETLKHSLSKSVFSKKEPTGDKVVAVDSERFLKHFKRGITFLVKDLQPVDFEEEQGEKEVQNPVTIEVPNFADEHHSKRHGKLKQTLGKRIKKM